MRVVNSNNIDLEHLKHYLSQGRGILVWLSKVGTTWIMRIIKKDSNNRFQSVSPFYNLEVYDERLLIKSLDELIEFMTSLIERTDVNKFYWFLTEEEFLNWCQTIEKEANDA